MVDGLDDERADVDHQLADVIEAPAAQLPWRLDPPTFRQASGERRTPLGSPRLSSLILVTSAMSPVEVAWVEQLQPVGMYCVDVWARPVHRFVYSTSAALEAFRHLR